MLVWNTTYQTSSSASQCGSVLQSVVSVFDGPLPTTTTTAVLDFAVTLSSHLVLGDSSSATALVNVVGNVAGRGSVGSENPTAGDVGSIQDSAKAALAAISLAVLQDAGVNVHPVVLTVRSRCDGASFDLRAHTATCFAIV